MKNTEILKKFNEQFIEALKEAQTSDFSYSWIPASLPHNGESGRGYNFLNQFYLNFLFAKRQYNNNLWLTFNQVKKLGGHVKKGEHGTFIVFSKKSLLYEGSFYDRFEDIPLENEEDINKVDKRFLLKYYLVWNTRQTEGLPEKYYKDEFEKAVLKPTFVDDFVTSTGAKIDYTEVNKNCYFPSLDTISLVRKKQFKDNEGYYSTLLHELAHWSGHGTRLNRFQNNEWLETKNKKYAFEELVAEITSAYLCRFFNIDKKIKHSAAYVKSWLTELENDTYFVYRAFAKAEQAFKYLLKTAYENGFNAIPGVVEEVA